MRNALQDSVNTINNPLYTSTKIIDDNDNQATIVENTQESQYELVSNLRAHICEDNTTFDNLTGGQVFTGAWQPILDYVDIIINVGSDQDSAIDGLKIQFSYDGVNSLDKESFTILANKYKKFSASSEMKYFRVVYTNGAITTGTLFIVSRLNRVRSKPSSHRISDSIVAEDDAELIKAVLTGEAEDGIFYNVKVTEDGSQFVKIIDSQNKKEISITPTRSMKTITPYRLVGTSFNGVNDPNFWTETLTCTGSITLGGQATLSTGTTANSTTKYQSVRKGRYVPGSFNQFRCITQTNDIGTIDNLRRIGAYSSDDGFYFQINGTTFGIGSRKSGVDTVINSGSFNGNWGDSFTLDNEVYRLYIDYGNLSVYFYVNDILLHTLSSKTTLTNTLTFPVTFENINSNGLTDNISINIRTAAIMRLGELHTNTIYKSIITNTTTVCKYGAGILHTIVNCDNAGNIIVYDNTTASGDIIAEIDTAKALGTLSFDAPFSNGLTVVTNLGASITVTYE